MENKINKEKLRIFVHKALKNWHVIRGYPETFIENFLIIKRHRKEVGSELNKKNLRGPTNQVLTDCIEMLARKDKLSATILRERFINGKTIVAVSLELSFSADQLNRRQRVAIEKLTEIIFSQEMVLREERAGYLL